MAMHSDQPPHEPKKSRKASWSRPPVPLTKFQGSFITNSTYQRSARGHEDGIGFGSNLRRRGQTSARAVDKAISKSVLTSLKP